MIMPVVPILPLKSRYKDLGQLIAMLQKAQGCVAQEGETHVPYVCYHLTRQASSEGTYEARHVLCTWIHEMLDDMPCLEMWLQINGYPFNVDSPVTDWKAFDLPTRRALIAYRIDWIGRMITQLESQKCQTTSP